jgi:hypothetical protein
MLEVKILKSYQWRQGPEGDDNLIMAEAVRNLNWGCQENGINCKHFKIYTQFSPTGVYD